MTTSASEAILKYESSQQFTEMSAITDSGDHKTFTTQAARFSGANGFAPVVRPNGLATGGAVSVALSGSNDVVDVAALTCWLAGVKTAVAADTDITITRGATTNTHIINSVTIDSTGAITVIAGTATTAFSTTRGASGGPPFIPVGSIEIAQIKLTSTTAAPIASTEIQQVPGLSQERFDYPSYTIDMLNGKILFSSALPTIHTSNTTKKVYASYAEPVMIDLDPVTDFVAPQQSVSVSSTQVYRGTVGNVTKSLSNGSFTYYPNNAVSDPFLQKEGDTLWFDFYPDPFDDNYITCQGVLGTNRAFPAANSVTAACTIAASSASKNVII